jgi:hypothetical protein
MGGNQSETGIPWGPYCYRINGSPNPTTGGIPIEVCPHWGRHAQRPDQENGYCSFTGATDWMDGTMLWDQVKCCGVNEAEPE